MWEVETARIVADLEAMADSDRLEWSKGNYPTAMKVIGVKIPDLRTVVKGWRKQLSKSAPKAVIDLAKQLVATDIFECRQVAYELVAGHKGALSALNEKTLIELGKGIDNWASADTFAALLAGPAWREGQISDARIMRWVKSPDHWWRRAAVVCTVAVNQKARGGSGDAPRTLAVCRQVAADRHDMVAKAVSWTLRELAKRDPQPVVDYLDEQDSVLPARVKREVRRKIETGRK